MEEELVVAVRELVARGEYQLAARLAAGYAGAGGGAGGPGEDRARAREREREREALEKATGDENRFYPSDDAAWLGDSALRDVATSVPYHRQRHLLVDERGLRVFPCSLIGLASGEPVKEDAELVGESAVADGRAAALVVWRGLRLDPTVHVACLGPWLPLVRCSELVLQDCEGVLPFLEALFAARAAGWLVSLGSVTIDGAATGEELRRVRELFADHCHAAPLVVTGDLGGVDIQTRFHGVRLALGVVRYVVAKGECEHAAPREDAAAADAFSLEAAGAPRPVLRLMSRETHTRRGFVCVKIVH